MRYVDVNYKTISEADVDLTVGHLEKAILIREDAEPIDNITKWAWADEDYEEVQMYVAFPEETVYEPSPLEDTDAMLIDHEYRLTMLELGITESEV